MNITTAFEIFIKAVFIIFFIVIFILLMVYTVDRFKEHDYTILYIILSTLAVVFISRKVVEYNEVRKLAWDPEDDEFDDEEEDERN